MGEQEDVTAWTGDIPVTGHRTLPPDPALMKAIGLNHALESALADLVDNSIDAGATHVLIRFVRNGKALVGLYVVDNGNGMDDEAIDSAMTVGKRRDYEHGQLGHFGVGLKAASLGQADNVVVLSRTRAGRPVGRRWLVEKATRNFECDVVSEHFARDSLERDWGFVKIESGTIIRLDQVRSFPTSRNPEVINKFLESTLVRIRRHLGLIYHRLLEHGRVAIAIDEEDMETSETGSAVPVTALDPFAYLRSGHPDYPATFTTELHGHPLKFEAHIWTGRSQTPEFRLSEQPDQWAGFYIYRGDRLLQTGGWSGVVNQEKRLQLARIAFEIDGPLADKFVINPEKTKAQPPAGFADAVEAATTADGATFDEYLEAARQTFKQSRQRNRTRPKVIPPGKGLSPRVRRAVGRELEFLPGEDEISIRWGDFYDESFFEMDRDSRTIWLNKKYRRALAKGRDGSLNDAPLVKTLLYLLAEELFRGAFWGAKDKDNLEIWQGILTTAAQEESDD